MPSHKSDGGTKSATCLWTKDRHRVRAVQKARLVKDMRSKNVREMTGLRARNVHSRAHTSGSMLEQSALRGRRKAKALV